MFICGAIQITRSFAVGNFFSFMFAAVSICLFFYLGFLLQTFTIHRTAGEEGGYLFNASLPLPPASQALRHHPGDYCRELTSTRSYQPGSNRELLVSECRLLTTKLRVYAKLGVYVLMVMLAHPYSDL